MEIYRISMIGHREIYGHRNLEDTLQEFFEEQLRVRDYIEFYLGRNGDFDIMAASAIKRAQRAVSRENSALILLQPYPMRNDESYSKYYDEIWYPVRDKTHPKAAITKRNRYMIENSDLLVAFVEKDRKGGAMTALKYAEKLGVDIINLAEENK